MPLRNQLRRFTWLALVAMLGLALAPTVSRALSVLGEAQSHDLVAPVAAAAHAGCDDAAAAADASAGQAGEALAPTLAHEAGHGQHGGGVAGGHDHLNHCPMCGIAATAWTVAPAPSALASVVNGGSRCAAASAEAPLPGARPWSAHNPRGPPSAA